MNDVIRLAAEQSAKRFGGNDGTFNAANFANTMRRIGDVQQTLDGKMVRTILAGRRDVDVLAGNHYRLANA